MIAESSKSTDDPSRELQKGDLGLMRSWVKLREVKHTPVVAVDLRMVYDGVIIVDCKL